MALEDSPDSPPGLSSSRSSTKSSSLCSSDHHNQWAPTDLSHFEDISLTDMYPSDAPRQINRPNKPRPLLRTNQSAPTPQTSRPTNLRDVSNGLRASVARNNHVRAIEAQKSPLQPNGYPLPTPLTIPPNHSKHGPRQSRLSPPSPPGPISPRLLRAQTDGLPLPRPRKPPSQAPRKTAKELEDEYNDEDDELPDDAFITNIPISPRPLHERSRSTSPEHISPNGHPRPFIDPDLGRPRSWDEALSDLSAEARALTLKLDSHAAALTRRHSADQNASVTSTQRPPPVPHTNTVSLPPLQRGNIMVDPLPASKEKEKHLTRTRPSWLPPKCQKEERKHLKEYQGMMQSFAESEKRRFAESEKHAQSSPRQSRDANSALRAWRHILGNWDAALEKPQTRELWWQGIPKTLRSQVWARAIGNDLQLSPVSFKAALARGKRLELRLAATFVAAQHRGHARQISAAESRADQRARRSLRTMDADISTNAFPTLKTFQQGQPRHHALRDLLLAYAAYREDTGHVRGTAAIAALILLQSLSSPTVTLSSVPSSPAPNSHKQSRPSSPSMNDQPPPQHFPEKPAVEEAANATAFITLANLLNRPLSLGFCINDAAAKERIYQHIAKVIQHKLAPLYEHFTSLMKATPQQLTWNDLLGPLCQSLMTSHLSVDEAARIADVLVLEGDGVVIRGVVGTLARLEASLYGSRGEVLSVLGWPTVSEGGEVVGRQGGLNACSPDEALSWVKWAGREEDAKPGR